MIKSFAHPGLRRFFETGSKAGIQPHHAERLRRQLFVLDHAKRPEDLGLPGWRLHRLSGTLVDHWSVHVDQCWRLTFRFDGDDAIVVNYQDYH